MYGGYLDKRVTITTIQKVFDGRGGYINKEVPLGEYWAALLPMTAVQITQYAAINTNVNVVCYMRYNPAIQKGQKIIFRGKTYEIRGVINAGFQDEFMELVIAEL